MFELYNNNTKNRYGYFFVKVGHYCYKVAMIESTYRYKEK